LRGAVGGTATKIVLECICGLLYMRLTDVDTNTATLLRTYKLSIEDSYRQFDGRLIDIIENAAASLQKGRHVYYLGCEVVGILGESAGCVQWV
jgi:hypothetical protein